MFAQDAKNALPVFESVLKDIANISADDLRLFTIKAHAIKSALAGIEETELSQIAFTLENAGRQCDKSTIAQKTQELIDALNLIIEKSRANADESSTGADKEDAAYLAEQLQIISDACAKYDMKTVNMALANLGKMSWTKETGELIDSISEHLLFSDFEKIDSLAKSRL
jgi:HPt (histidine-containing phosphotransfer) domain-containing protein